MAKEPEHSMKGHIMSYAIELVKEADGR